MTSITKMDAKTYSRIHKWVTRNWGKATQCQNSKYHVGYRFEWSNISGEYRLEREDWQQLCRYCHIKYDKAQRELNKYCRRGHEYTKENTRWRITGRSEWRICRKCNALHARMFQERKISKELSL